MAQSQSPRPLKEIGSVTAINSTLYLGGVPFGPLEHPDSLKFAIEQSLAKKTKIGGGRTIHALGPQFDDISWTGKLYNDTARGFTVQGRCQRWKQMAADGKSRLLKWRHEQYYVVVQRFAWDWIHKNLAAYEMHVVVQREVTGATSTAQVPSIDNQVSSLTDRASSQVTSIVNTDAKAQPIATSFVAMKSQIAASGPLATTSGSVATKLAASVQQTLGTVQKYAAEVGIGFPRSHAINIASLASTLSVTLKTLNQGQNARTVRVNGGTIEDIVVREYGDITLARQVQRANGLSSNRLPTGVITDIILPPLTGIKL